MAGTYDVRHVGLPAADVPVPFKGNAIALITAGLMSMAFMGFAGLVQG